MPIVPADAVYPPPLVESPLEPADEVEDPPLLPPVLPANPAFGPPAHHLPPQGSYRGSNRGSIPTRSAHPSRASRRIDGSGALGGNESSDEDHVPRRRGRRQSEAPQFAEQMQLRINTLTADLMAETLGRERFEAFFRPDFLQAAETLAMYRISTIAVIRQTDKDARRMFSSDPRDLERKTFPETQLLMQLFPHFALVAKQREPERPAF